MKKNNKCMKCNCTDIIVRATVLVPQGHIGGSDYVCVETTLHSEAIFKKNKKREAIQAYICRGCGYTELYVASPNQL